jgi:hypothetical protein
MDLTLPESHRALQASLREFCEEHVKPYARQWDHEERFPIEVVKSLGEDAPRRIVYVSCDPATLARDIGLLMAHGWVLAGLRAFDAFPMTHHVECVATLTAGPED